jgi:hypothetical protein
VPGRTTATLDEPLQRQNTSSLYDPARMMRIGERLLKTDGAQWKFYSKESVEGLLEELTTASHNQGLCSRFIG